MTHVMRQTFLGEQFPRICIRCLTRSDDPAIDQPCNALFERMMSDD